MKTLQVAEKKLFVDLQKSLFYEKWHFPANIWEA